MALRTFVDGHLVTDDAVSVALRGAPGVLDLCHGHDLAQQALREQVAQTLGIGPCAAASNSVATNAKRLNGSATISLPGVDASADALRATQEA